MPGPTFQTAALLPLVHAKNVIGVGNPHAGLVIQPAGEVRFASATRW